MRHERASSSVDLDRSTIIGLGYAGSVALGAYGIYVETPRMAVSGVIGVTVTYLFQKITS